ncbi:MAG: T9SS type A sorting domain-containing protein [Bacteroidales bacterium]|nr:T9SS type A sorting domain-containing protein [Bacteroidales bacterium]
MLKWSNYFNIAGQQVAVYENVAANQGINIATMQHGVYIAKITSSTGATHVSKVFIK